MDRDFFFNAGLQFEQSPQPTWKLMRLLPEMNFPGEQSIADGISKPNWEKSDQLSQIDSALSSMVSSPVSNSTVSTDIVAVRELIGKMGNGSPAAMTVVSPYSSNNSPLNSSPTKLSSPIMDQFVKENFPRIWNSMPMNPNLQLLSTDPGFAERAAKFSCFGSRSFNGRINQSGLNSNPPNFQSGSNSSPITSTKFPRVSSSPALTIDRSTVGFKENKISEEPNSKLSRLSCSAANSNEESFVSQEIPCGELGIKNQKDSNSRKRKGSSSTGIGSVNKKEEEPIDDSNSKKMKIPEQHNGGKKDESTKPLEAPKDYVHVRARRGQATDSHSLAERVRREKISERMKLLQDLVPNCNKITGKALMLDEIINYVQSLQRQVEFLSMKLATVNPSLDYATDSLLSQNTQAVFNDPISINQSAHEFIEPFPQFPGFGQDDLQSIVQMGFGENLDLDVDPPFFPAAHDQPSSMKMEF